MDMLTVFSAVLFITGIILIAYSGRFAESIYKNFATSDDSKKNTDFLRIRILALGFFFFAGGLGNLIYQFKSWK